MWEAMMRVRPGMASSGEDPTVRALEERMAELTGHEAALFLPTTTNCTVAAFLASDLPGKVMILESRSHIYWMERLHVSQLSGATPRLVQGDKFGVMSLATVEGVLTESAYGQRHAPGYFCLENSHNVCGGTVLSPEYTAAAGELVRRYGGKLFLDGARVFNSAAALDVELRALTAPADAMVTSLNKGLGAPLGGLLCGTLELIDKARDVARRTGMLAVHRAGIFAAAALVAIDEMAGRLGDDHRRARLLAEELDRIDGLAVDLETVQTNLVRVSTEQSGVRAMEVAQKAAAHGLAVHVLEAQVFKLAVCYAIDDAQLERAITILSEVMDELA
jgi:threonine aldolase